MPDSSPRDFTQIQWSPALQNACRQLLTLAKAEDLGEDGDLTSQATIPADRTGSVVFRLRATGVVAGLPTLQTAVDLYDPNLELMLLAEDGRLLPAGTPLARLTGSARSILAVERPALNLLSRLCGIATQTHQWTELLKDLPARIYDTRKTTPGLRLLEKYAVRCGGGTNHRTGLYDAVLIKDNHLALGGSASTPLSPSTAVHMARDFLTDSNSNRRDAGHDNATNHQSSNNPRDRLIEIEVDTWEQFTDAITATPDVILLDNMSCELMSRAVAHRNQTAPHVQLEASGGITQERLVAVAKTGVDRISLGALTHSAIQLDIGLDWDPTDSNN